MNAFVRDYSLTEKQIGHLMAHVCDQACAMTPEASRRS